MKQNRWNGRTENFLLAVGVLCFTLYSIYISGIFRIGGAVQNLRYLLHDYMSGFFSQVWIAVVCIVCILLLLARIFRGAKSKQKVAWGIAIHTLTLLLWWLVSKA